MAYAGLRKYPIQNTIHVIRLLSTCMTPKETVTTRFQDTQKINKINTDIKTDNIISIHYYDQLFNSYDLLKVMVVAKSKHKQITA